MIIELGSVYKNTSLFYFYFVIKKKIKKHHLIHLEELYYDVDLGDVITVGGILINQDQYPNHWQLNLGGQERLFLDAQGGDMRITGRMHAIGSVVWNQELHRLEYWDGTTWQHLISQGIV